MPSSINEFKFAMSGKYRIVVQGTIRDDWSDRLAGLNITNSTAGDVPKTTLVGTIRDQAQLSGILNTLYDLHLSILLVENIADQNNSNGAAV